MRWILKIILFPIRLLVKYPHCISDIPARHRNNYSIFLDADVYRCCNRIIYTKRYITWN